MRQIVLDTETTGLNPRAGDRVIEIGCVELVNRRLSGRNFHRYFNPGRDSDPGALAVHGLTTEFLSDKPKFESAVDELCEFLAGAEVLIHNAPFDVGFLDAELGLIARAAFHTHVGSITDTLLLAKELHPGKRNSLDALCERYGVSNAHRTLHGALLDAELLAEVYLGMTRGQDSLVIEMDAAPPTMQAEGDAMIRPTEFIVLRASAEELIAHEMLLGAIAKETKKAPVWPLAPAP